MPLLLPLLLYSGPGEWPNATSLGEQRKEAPLWLRDDQPMLRYRVVGTRAQAANVDLNQQVNFAAALFRLQHARSPREMGQILERLGEWLERDQYPGLERDLTLFARWRLRVLSADRKVPACKTLVEVLRMVEDEETWWQTARREGKQEGVREGMRKGVGKTLRLFLEQHYGDALPGWAVARITGAAEDDLLHWATQLPHHSGSLKELLVPWVPGADVAPLASPVHKRRAGSEHRKRLRS